MKYLLTFILGLVTYPLIVDISNIIQYNTNSKIAEIVYYKIWMPNYGIANVFTTNCTKDVSKNGHGWIFVNREYYACNKVQIYFSDLIYGEYTQERSIFTKDPKSRKRVGK